MPIELAGQTLMVRIGLDDEIKVYRGDRLAARHQLRSRDQGWVTTPEHHRALWQSTLSVEQRSLQTYEEAAKWS